MFSAVNAFHAESSAIQAFIVIIIIIIIIIIVTRVTYRFLEPGEVLEVAHFLYLRLGDGTLALPVAPTHSASRQDY